MAWIESHEELLSHPKSKRLKRKLNVSIHEVVGILHFFWHWAIKYAEDGDITKFSSEDIADAIEFDGDADNLIQSLIESGFVDEVEGTRIIHDWFDYGGKLILWRRKEADRLKKYRADKTKKVKEQVSYEERTPYAHSTDTVRTPERVTVTDTVIKDIKYIKDMSDSNECELMFEQFYNIYTPKQGSVRKEALKSWNRLWKANKINASNIGLVIESALAYLSYQKSKKLNVCGAQVFLNQERWLDQWESSNQKESATTREYRADEAPDFVPAEPPTMF